MDHPAPAGKTRIEKSNIGKKQGSPRTCGKTIFLCYNKHGFRITPHLRKTHQFFLFSHRYPGSPRTCGENKTVSLPAWLNTGSPPHLRGNKPMLPIFFDLLRITPHLRENEYYTVEQIGEVGSPRTCGENYFFVVCKHIHGDHPHLRGKRPYQKQEKKDRGSPRTCGKTNCIFIKKFSVRDHPRTCGKTHQCGEILFCT